MTDPAEGLRARYLNVGKPLEDGVTSWPEGAVFFLTPHSGVVLELYYRSPTPEEVHSIWSGQATFGWADGAHVGFLGYRFGTLEWNEYAWTPHRDPEYGPEPDYEDGKHQLVNVVLTDSATGIVRALRQMSWSPGFIRAVRATAERLAKADYSVPDVDNAIDTARSLFPDPADLVMALADVTCQGGTPGDSTRYRRRSPVAPV